MDQTDLPDTGLLVKLDKAKTLQQLLKMLQFKEEVVVRATNNGIKVTAEVSRSFFGSAFIQKETFNEYSIKTGDEEDPEMVFNISLSTLVHCLNISGSGGSSGSGLTTLTGTTGMNVNHASLVLHYPEHGQPLSVWLEENGIVTGATIPTLDLRDDFVDFAAMMAQNNSKIVSRIILQAEHLCDIFNEFDSKSDWLEFTICPTNQTLTMSTSSPTVSNFSVEIPFDSGIVSHFQVEEYISTKYQFSTLKYALKPMAMADKVSIRFDSRQFLSIQYMIKMTDTACFMEFYCAPEIDC